MAAHNFEHKFLMKRQTVWILKYLPGENNAGRLHEFDFMSNQLHKLFAFNPRESLWNLLTQETA
jgi:hypothetical protein